jgi:hypothetical protein
MSTAQAVTIDFESITNDPNALVEHNEVIYFEDGFAVKNNISDTVPLIGVADNWDGIGSSNGTVTAAAAGEEGGDYARFVVFLPENIDQLAIGSLKPFSLFSIDFGEIVNTGNEFESVVADSVLVTGYLSNGDTVSTTINLDLISDGIGGADDFQTFTFDSQWTNLNFVDFYATRQEVNGYVPLVNFDNIVVSAVPVPAAFWLFGSGLIGLIGVARRKKAA